MIRLRRRSALLVPITRQRLMPLAFPSRTTSSSSYSLPFSPSSGSAVRGGSPPGSQEALLEATRLTMWKLYNGSFNGLAGGLEEDSKTPLGLGPQPPQKEALNLEFKEEVRLSHPNDRIPYK